MLVYKTGTETIDWESLMSLYVETDGVIGLARAGDLPRIKAAFAESYRVVTAWEGGQVVGAGRLISDGECYGWIHDMAVLPEHQKEGIGRGIVEALLKGNEHLLIGLRSADDAVGFYQRLGFKKHKTSFAKDPEDPTQLEG